MKKCGKVSEGQKKSKVERREYAITFAEANRRRMLGTVRCIRQGVAVFEVKDVHADFTRLVFYWCDDLAAHELGAYTEITRRKKDKQEGEQSYWISCYT